MTQTWGDDIRQAEQAIADAQALLDDLNRRVADGEEGITEQDLLNREAAIRLAEKVRDGAMQRAAAARLSGALDDGHAVHTDAAELIDHGDDELGRLFAAHIATGAALHQHAVTRHHKARDIISRAAHVRDRLDQLGEGNGRDVMRKRLGLTTGHDGIIIHGDQHKRMAVIDPAHVIAAAAELILGPADSGTVLNGSHVGRILEAAPALAAALGLDPATAHTVGNLGDPGRANVIKTIRERHQAQDDTDPLPGIPSKTTRT